MSIPIAVDGVTLVDAALLNSYKSGIEACEPGLGLPASSGYLLASDDEGGRSWVPAPSSSPTTAEGDLIVRGAAADEALPVGDEGQALVVASGVPAWVTLPGLPSVCDARLTLTQGVPVTTSDVIGASTIYLTRYRGAHVALWNGSAWVLHAVPSGDVSLALSGLTDGSVYDVFLHDDSGTLALSLSAAWADNVTRTDALAYQDGIRVLASDHGKRLVGTICATGATTTASSVNFRYVRNEAHPVPQVVRVLGLAETWSYNKNKFRALNNDATCCIRYLSDGKSPLDVTAKLSFRDTYTGARQLAWALDVIDKENSYAAPGTNFWDNRGVAVAARSLSTRMPIMAAEGRHTVWPVENCSSMAEWPGCDGVVLA